MNFGFPGSGIDGIEEKYCLFFHLQVVDFQSNKAKQCTICGKRFSGGATIAHIRTHMKTAHEDVLLHNCKFCSKTYFSLDNLKKHVEKIHNNDPDRDHDQNHDRNQVHDRDQEENFKNNDDSLGNDDDQEIEKVSGSADNEKSKQTANDMSENEDFVEEILQEEGEKEEDLESLSSNSNLEIDVNDEPTDELNSTKSSEQNSSDEDEDFEISFKKDKKADKSSDNNDSGDEQSQSQE